MKKRRQVTSATNQAEVEIELEDQDAAYAEGVDLEIDMVDELDLSDDTEIDMDDLEDTTNDDETDEESNDPDESTQDEDIEELDFNLDDVTPSISKTVSRIPEAGVLSVVNSKDNGKRVAIARDVHQKLSEPSSLQIGFMNNCMLLGKQLGDTYTSYPLRKQGAKQMIYSKALVEQITNHFQLDFSNRTSITFHSVTYKKMNDQVIAIISKN
ncbi:hypothetical protein [Bacillus seohaeanensis]|jgi:hypothetical protein|uniref:Uncharacterized protein n=1 Tax=Bacillus seohaeanensis TaxID=284580 RepID=A0ABW5RKQ6_9BACI